MRTLIGFNTTSKQESQKEMSKVSNPIIKQHAIVELEKLNNIICGEEFQRYSPNDKQQILIEFAQLSILAYK
jgi:hypothetical protein